MSVLLESGMVRSFLHHLVDKLIDDLEASPVAKAVGAVLSVALAERSKPRITVGERKPVPPMDSKAPKRTGRQARGDVLVGCGWRAKRPAVLLRLSETVSERLGLGPGPACDCKVEQVGKTLIVQPGRGLRAWRQPGGRQYLVGLATAHRWGLLGPHRSEVCAWHFDLENRLVIQVPAWLPAAGSKAPVVVSPPQVRSKKNNSKPKDGPPVTCKKMAGTNPMIKCAMCQKEPATVECSLCPTLVGDKCWGDHVRMHWHSAHRGKAGTAAHDARQAMRTEA